MSGEIATGEPLREITLADRFQTSRTTIREAVMMLEFDGLITRERNRGAVVRRLTADNLSNLQACRRGLEAGAVSLPMSPERLEEVRLALLDLEHVASLGDREQTMESDYRFHASLIKNFESERLSDLFASVFREQSIYLRTLATYHDEFEEEESYLDEHRHIYHALVAGDHASACRYVKQHIDITYSRFSTMSEQDLRKGLGSAGERSRGGEGSRSGG